jgi:restriction system protein
MANEPGSTILSTHGGYRTLKSYQGAEIIHDATVAFCRRFMSDFDRTKSQMVQAARSGKQNIVEGTMASGTSKEMELKLLGVARASLKELLTDYEDYLRQHELQIWDRSDAKTARIREMVYVVDRTYETYEKLVTEEPAETAANTVICLIHQTTYLLRKQLMALEEEFLRDGDLRERMSAGRRQRRRR